MQSGMRGMWRSHGSSKNLQPCKTQAPTRLYSHSSPGSSFRESGTSLRFLYIVTLESTRITTLQFHLAQVIFFIYSHVGKWIENETIWFLPFQPEYKILISLSIWDTLMLYIEGYKNSKDLNMYNFNFASYIWSQIVAFSLKFLKAEPLGKKMVQRR